MLLAVEDLEQDEKGALWLNKALPYIGGGVLVPDPANQPLVVPARSGQANGTASIVLEAQSDAWEQILSLIKTQDTDDDPDVTARLLVQLYDFAHAERQLQNRPIPATHVFGSQLNPFFLDEEFAVPLLLHPQQLVRADFINPSSAGDANVFVSNGTIRAHGRAISYDDKLKKLLTDERNRMECLCPYWMVSDSNIPDRDNVPGIQLAAGAVRQIMPFFNKRPDLTFLITSVLATAISTGQRGDTEGQVAFEIFTPGDNQAIQNQPVTINCGAGNAMFPHRLHTPLAIAPKDQFTVYATNLITDATTDFFLTFFGVGILSNPADTGMWKTTGKYTKGY